MRLIDLICDEAVLPDLGETTRDAVIERLVGALAQAGRVPHEAVPALVSAIIDREKKGSTGFGKGVAVPHTKHPTVSSLVAAVGTCRTGIDFNSLDGRPVTSVVVVLSPPDRSKDHLDAMQGFFKRLHDDAFRRGLRQASTGREILDLIEAGDPG
jgi:mannitol/fructose-specific phosphotransferase system IIA component (Ntr-type)